MYCTKCGGEIPEATDFCVFCGQPVQGVKMQPAMRSVNNGYVAKKPKIRIPAAPIVLGIIGIIAIIAIVSVAGISQSGTSRRSASRTESNKLSANMKKTEISKAKVNIDTLYQAYVVVLSSPEFNSDKDIWGSVNYGVIDGEIDIYEAADFEGPESFLDQVAEYVGSDTIQMPSIYEDATVHIQIDRDISKKNRVSVSVYTDDEECNFSIAL